MIAPDSTAVQEHGPPTCISCGMVLSDHSAYCLTCQTPVDVSRSVADRGTPPRFVSVLGASGAGKTVYLGMLLDMLSKGARGLRGLPNGPFSVAVQQQTVAALQQRRFPEKTPSEADTWRWVHCEVTRVKKPRNYIDIITPDFAGEAIAMEIEHPETFPTIRSIVRRSQAMLVLFDAPRVSAAGRDEDFFAMKLASYINNLHRKEKRLRWRRLPVPIAVVLTKADMCAEALENPVEFAAANLPGLVQFCERNLSRYRFFASSVVGNSATMTDSFGRQMRIPLHVEPHGILEPLDWIMTHL